MSLSFDDLLFINITWECLQEFVNCLALNYEIPARLLEVIGMQWHESINLPQVKNIEIAKSFCEKLKYRNYCLVWGRCQDPENHWPQYCSTFGKLTEEIKRISGDNTHPALGVLYDHESRIIERFKNNSKFRIIPHN